MGGYALNYTLQQYLRFLKLSPPYTLALVCINQSLVPPFIRVTFSIIQATEAKREGGGGGGGGGGIFS